MKLGSFDLLIRALDEAGVRYLVAGGLAVNATGALCFDPVAHPDEGDCRPAAG
jgi:hypothetical protein